MAGPGSEGGGRPATVLVFEHVTGGGLAGRTLPGSWAAEGAAMRRAICRDFAAVPGVRVVTPVDARLPAEAPPGVEVRAIADRDGDWFATLAAQADCTVLIAPESDGILAGLAGTVARVGGGSLGSGPRAVALAGDKARLAGHLAGHGVPTPAWRLIEGRPPGGDWAPPGEWDGPIVIKPRWGAGSVDTVVVRDRRIPDWVPRDGTFLAQPYLPGRPMSASFLVDREGRPTLLAAGRQAIGVDAGGRIAYRGGTILADAGACPAAAIAAIDCVVGALPAGCLLGFVGVDFLLDDRGEATVLEINPRPTTSYVGLARLFPPGTIAGAWLAAAAGPLAGTPWPDRLRLAPGTPPASFEADGTTRPRPGDPSR